MIVLMRNEVFIQCLNVFSNYVFIAPKAQGRYKSQNNSKILSILSSKWPAFKKLDPTLILRWSKDHILILCQYLVICYQLMILFLR